MTDYAWQDVTQDPWELPCPDCGALPRQPCDTDCPRYEEAPGD